MFPAATVTVVLKYVVRVVLGAQQRVGRIAVFLNVGYVE